MQSYRPYNTSISRGNALTTSMFPSMFIRMATIRLFATNSGNSKNPERSLLKLVNRGSLVVLTIHHPTNHDGCAQQIGRERQVTPADGQPPEISEGNRMVCNSPSEMEVALICYLLSMTVKS